MADTMGRRSGVLPGPDAPDSRMDVLFGAFARGGAPASLEEMLEDGDWWGSGGAEEDDDEIQAEMQLLREGGSGAVREKKMQDSVQAWLLAKRSAQVSGALLRRLEDHAGSRRCARARPACGAPPVPLTRCRACARVCALCRAQWESGRIVRGFSQHPEPQNRAVRGLGCRVRATGAQGGDGKEGAGIRSSPAPCRRARGCPTGGAFAHQHACARSVVGCRTGRRRSGSGTRNAGRRDGRRCAATAH